MNIISIIIGHSNRIKCILHNLLKYKNKITHFKFGAIIRLEINKNGVFIELVNEGKMTKSDLDKYYRENPAISFYEGNIFKENIQLNNLKLNNLDLDNNYIFYIIRHSKKLYTSSNTIHSNYLLTNYGIKLSFTIGNNLLKILKQKNETNINYLFISELRRARLTMACIIYKLLNDSLIKIKYKKMIVIPCLYELNDIDDNYCRERTNNPYDLIIIKYNKNNNNNNNKIYEEKIIYDLDNVNVIINKNTTITIYNKLENIKKIIKTNWEYYLEFYNGIRNKFLHQKKCVNINIIKTIINIINKDIFKV